MFSSPTKLCFNAAISLTSVCSASICRPTGKKPGWLEQRTYPAWAVLQEYFEAEQRIGISFKEIAECLGYHTTALLLALRLPRRARGR